MQYGSLNCFQSVPFRHSTSSQASDFSFELHVLLYIHLFGIPSLSTGKSRDVKNNQQIAPPQSFQTMNATLPSFKHLLKFQDLLNFQRSSNFSLQQPVEERPGCHHPASVWGPANARRIQHSARNGRKGKDRSIRYNILPSFQLLLALKRDGWAAAAGDGKRFSAKKDTHTKEKSKERTKRKGRVVFTVKAKGSARPSQDGNCEGLV
jgi:hypothetical protein